MTNTKLRTYSELMQLETFEERLEYLKLSGRVAVETFGFDRIFYEQFLKSEAWKRVRRDVIIRDLGADFPLDLGCEDHNITGTVIVHHMNPIRMDDISKKTDFLLNPEYLICTSLDTHNYIHYGVKKEQPKLALERRPGDTCPWKKEVQDVI